MLELTPNLFSYKMFTSPTTQITEDDLCNALGMYQDLWTVEDLKLAITKVGLTSPIKERLRTYKNPLTSNFKNKDDNAEYIVLRPRLLTPEYMTPAEYQRTLYNAVIVTNLYTIKQTRQYTDTPKLELYLIILKRHPKTTQSTILIDYITQVLKDN